MEKQGDFQPWTEFIQASSDFRAGFIEEGYRMREIGINHAYGPGFFSEVGPRQETCGLPPYISAHGSYMTALTYQFITASIWEKKIGVFSAMPMAYRDKSIRIRDMHAIGNVRITAEYDRLEVNAELEGELMGYTLIMPVPFGIGVDNMRVLVNGSVKTFKYCKAARTVEFEIDDDCGNYFVSVR